MNDPFDIYTNTPCGGGDMPGWMVAALCAIPVLLVSLDILGGCR